MAGYRRERTAWDNPAVVCRLVDEACNASNLGIPDAVLAPGGGAPDPAAPGAGGLDRERIKQALRLFRAAVPDARWTIVEHSAAEDTVVTRLACVGRTGVGCGASPRPAEKGGGGVLIGRFAHGRQVAYLAQADLLSLLCQLGMLPSLDLDKVVAVACALRASEALAGQMSLQGRSTVSGA
jgi:SnoaL-like polyketide cyclase